MLITHLQKPPGQVNALRKFFLAVAMTFIAIAGYCNSNRILDPKAKNHEFLRSLSDALHKEGIDVRQSWQSNPRVGSRPILAPLDGYQSFLNIKEESVLTAEARWINDFKKGVIGTVVGFKSGSSRKGQQSMANWFSTPQSQRIFISFAREDVSTAWKIKAILEKRGYTAFIYLDGPNAIPGQSLENAGMYMRSAGEHFVIDTDVARTKPGVLAEALFHTKYIHPQRLGQSIRGVNPPKVPNASSLDIQWRPTRNSKDPSISTLGNKTAPSSGYWKKQKPPVIPPVKSIPPTVTSSVGETAIWKTLGRIIKRR